jgi:predicted nucleotide-binding protein
VFVGSSVESLKYANAIQQNLDPYDADVTVWPQGVFRISAYGLESLLEAARSHDFGVFLFAADDVIIIKNQLQSAVRDNVIFELGLFMGRLGRNRNFIVAAIGVDLHLPTDLLGMNTAGYDPNRADAVAAVGSACGQIRSAIQQLGNFQPDSSTESVISAAETIEAAPSFPTVNLVNIRQERVRESGETVEIDPPEPFPWRRS